MEFNFFRYLCCSSDAEWWLYPEETLILYTPKEFQNYSYLSGSFLYHISHNLKRLLLRNGYMLVIYCSLKDTVVFCREYITSYLSISHVSYKYMICCLLSCVLQAS